MNDDEIKGLLQREIKSARSNDDTELAANRRKALEYYKGEMTDLKPEPGRSSVVSRDVADHVGWILPQLMRTFCASASIVDIEPTELGVAVLPTEIRGFEQMTPEQLREAMEQEQNRRADEQARNAEILLNHIFWKENKGYRVLRDASWDSLVVKNAVVKVFNDDTPEYATQFMSNLLRPDMDKLEADDEVEVTHETKTQTDIGGETVDVFEVKVKRLKSKSRRKIVVIPPEDYFQDEEATSTEDARFRAHRMDKTRSDLIAMGFDRKVVMDLGTDKDDDPEDRARGKDDDQQNDLADKSMETIELFECYLKVDVDDDGLAEVIRAYYAGTRSGGELLDWEVWEDEGPFYDIPCDPIPHRWDGNSIADETMDIQRVKTAMWRQFNDNIYASNNPQRFVLGEIVNPDELFAPTFGGAVFGKPGSSVTDLKVPMVAEQALAGMTYADEVAAKRTGVSRQSQALDPEGLNNQSATANQNNKDAAYSQVEQIARDMAELGWEPIFSALLRLEIKYQDKPRKIRYNKKWIDIDPRPWNADMALTVNVGLGTGSRDRDLLMLRQVLESQLLMADRFMAAGAVDDAIDMLPKIVATMVKMAESAGLRNPTDFYPEYTEDKVAKLKQMAAERAKQPSPDMAKAQADAQLQQQKLAADQQNTQAKMAMDAQQSEADLMIRREQIAAEMELKREQLAAELSLKREQMAAELQLQREIGMFKASQVNASTSAVHVGGEPG